MMRNITRLTITLAILGWSCTAMAALDALEDALELSVDEVMLPASSVGSLVVRRSASAEPELLQVSSDTAYFIGFKTQSVTLKQVRDAVKAGQGEMLVVAISNETGKISRIVLDGPTMAVAGRSDSGQTAGRIMRPRPTRQARQ